MSKLKTILVFLALVLLVQLSFSQFHYSTTNKKAIKYFDQAMEFFQKKEMESCEENLLKAIKEDETFTEAHLLLAQIYDEQKKYEQAIDAYCKVLETKPDQYKNIYFSVANIEFSLGKYSESLEHFVKFLKYDNIDTQIKNKAEFLLKCCEFAVEAIKNPVPFNPINLGPEVNSKFDDYYPYITIDDEKLLFTRNIYDPRNIHGVQEDFFICEKFYGAWRNTYNIGKPINTNRNEGAPTFSIDGKIIIFTACDNMIGDYGNNRTGFGSCDLFYTNKIGPLWSNPINLGQPVNSAAWETQPSLSSDGRTLYFIRGRAGTRDKSDIYYSNLQENGEWSVPIRMPDNINTPFEESSVFIHPDNKTMYFSSNGHIGMGGYDIYITRKDSLGNWSDPINLGYPINTGKNEAYIFINSQGNLAYFSSNRVGGYGGLDIYSFELYPEVRPSQVTYMKGIVYDSKTKKRLQAKFELIDLSTSQTAAQSVSDAQSGEFLVSLPSDKNYALNVSKDGYLFYSENFELKGDHSMIKPFLKDVYLQPIETGSVVILKNIFFDFDKFDLRPESQAELNRLFDLLKKNASMKIEIGGHTDNKGSAEYNQKLSESRAQSVYDYLIAKGIDKIRLSYKGYGLTKPIDTNDTDEGRANNRRTEFKVVSY